MLGASGVHQFFFLFIKDIFYFYMIPLKVPSEFGKEIVTVSAEV